MSQHHIFILILLLQVILDAVGDGFRMNSWQKAHHTMETLREGIWIALIAAVSLGWLDFQWYYVAMYILGRIWLFDPVINLVAREDFFYIAKSSWDGVILYWLAYKFRVPVILPAAMIKLMALAWWIAWLVTDGG